MTIEREKMTVLTDGGEEERFVDHYESDCEESISMNGEVVTIELKYPVPELRENERYERMIGCYPYVYKHKD